jgi:hypothetical protein
LDHLLTDAPMGVVLVFLVWREWIRYKGRRQYEQDLERASNRIGNPAPVMNSTNSAKLFDLLYSEFRDFRQETQKRLLAIEERLGN